MMNPIKVVFNKDHAPPLPNGPITGWISSGFEALSLELGRQLPSATSDAQRVSMLKAHIVSGGRLDVVHANTDRSTLELIADRAHQLISLDVLEFLLRHGAPIVLIDARGAVHDAFVALLNAGVGSEAPHRVALLRRLLAAGYEPSPSVLLDGVQRARHDADVHAFLCDLLAAVQTPLAPPPLHFALGVNCAALMRELDRVPYLPSDSVSMVLFERLLHEAELWSHASDAAALLTRLFDALPEGVGGAALCDRLIERKPVHCGALTALLPRLTIDDDATARQLFNALLSQPQWINGSVVDAKLVALACERTAGSGVPDKLPLLAMAAAQPALADDVLLLLIANGADPNQRLSSDGRTPLHHSATLAHHRVLVAAGADRTLRDHAGKTAFDLALEANRIEESFFLLKEAGGDQQREVVLFTIESTAEPTAEPGSPTTKTPDTDPPIDVDVPLMVKQNNVVLLAELCVGTKSEQRMSSLLANGVLSVLMSNVVPLARVSDLVSALDGISAIGALSVALRDRVLGAGAAVRLLDVVTRTQANRDPLVTKAARRLAATLAAGAPPPAVAQSQLLTATLSACSD